MLIRILNSEPNTSKPAIWVNQIIGGQEVVAPQPS